jgi:hypothetical protein
MKKTTQTLLLVFSTLLLLVSVTVTTQAQPSQAPSSPNFNGTWNTVTGKGKTISMTLRHERADFSVVTGSYGVNGLTGSYKPSAGSMFEIVKVSASTAEPVPQNKSSITGKVTGNVLRFIWAEDGGQGAGRFTLSSDGESFEGTFSHTNNPDDTSGGTWNGTRVHSFAGAWQATFGETTMMLILQQNGSQVTGQLNVNSAVLGVIREGIVDGNTLRFKVVRARTLPNGLNLPDEYVGTGELVMDAGGKSFKGNVLGTATSGTHVGR